MQNQYHHILKAYADFYDKLCQNIHTYIYQLFMVAFPFLGDVRIHNTCTIALLIEVGLEKVGLQTSVK